MRERTAHDDRSTRARPVVLIAALRRTGSTLLAEALTDLPHAFVFREPRLFQGFVDLKSPDVDLLRSRVGIDLSTAPVRRQEPAAATRHFVEAVYRPLASRVAQIGLKEIRYGSGWADTLTALSAAAPLRVVALGRDPRDIYLSLESRARVRAIHLDGPFGPASVARDLGREFALQRELIAHTHALTVRYEDLCTDGAVLDEIRSFVDSPVTGNGAIGLLRSYNRDVHGRRLTDSRVGRWRREPDADLVEAATETRDRLGDYCRFWGYPT